MKPGVYVGWQNQTRIHSCFLHLDIKDGKIWIQHNGTKEHIAYDLVAKGVLKEDIVLGFQAPQLPSIYRFREQLVTCCYYMKIQKYTPNNTTPLAKIYQAAILKLGSDHYTQEQLQVWSAWANKFNFHQYLQNGKVLVAIKNESIVSFGQLFPNNHIALLYTHPSHARQGLAKNIYLALEKIAFDSGEKTLSVNASKVSKPFFEVVGFQIVEEEIIVRNQVEILRYKMRKLINVY